MYYYLTRCHQDVLFIQLQRRAKSCVLKCLICLMKALLVRLNSPPLGSNNPMGDVARCSKALISKSTPTAAKPHELNWLNGWRVVTAWGRRMRLRASENNNERQRRSDGFRESLSFHISQFTGAHWC